MVSLTCVYVLAIFWFASDVAGAFSRSQPPIPTGTGASFHRGNGTHKHRHPGQPEGIAINNQTRLHRPRSWEPKKVVVDQDKPIVIITNTTAIKDNDLGPTPHLTKRRSSVTLSTKSTFLVIARDATIAYSAKSGLNDYGIAFEVFVVPSGGATLPALTSPTRVGKYGGIVILSEVSYANSGGNYVSALTDTQWNSLYEYQRTFGVRMVRLDVVPGSATGTRVLGSCCDGTVDQLLAFDDTSAFPGAGLVVGATLSTQGLYHYPAAISNSKLATPFATFRPAAGFPTTSVAGVINDFKDGRQQMVFFLGFATDWSTTSILLTHAWIHWATRGLFAGYRRAILNTQVDDMFLTTAVYSGGLFRTEPADLEAHISWMASVNAKLPQGSNYTIEVGHNGNGNIGSSYDIDGQDDGASVCGSGPVQYDSQTPASAEYVKPPGTGTSLWSNQAGDYPYSEQCVILDPLRNWWSTDANRDAFMHVSHTFTHESEDQATYYDVSKEIQWNQAWMAHIGISLAVYFSGRGLIPPAITGLHNGDALRAWSENGIVHAVGDNTRKILLNANNEHWPLITTVSGDNFAGVYVMPRWASNIYYNCDTTACDVAEWIAIASGSGSITDLLTLEKSTNTRHLLSLHHDAYMFHQANTRQADVGITTAPGGGLTAKSGKWSLLQMWVETVLGEFARVVNWPIISLKHDDLAASFIQRMARDKCKYTMTLIVDTSQKIITGVTIASSANICTASIPVTLPGKVRDTLGFVTEQLNSQDPLVIWVPLTGSEVKLTFSVPISW
ncbi:related to extracellular serine-rich protein [Rhynchosporium secalis]|uniref:Related to extracellular serine-rich protein n=1 Tax=Rhynchosporium secalis TaxID=38038 RepID=A0A1E1MHI5_RHYSE|nr:related to extracellular serine-rich protein [Rhynchosporium secalis]